MKKDPSGTTWISKKFLKELKTRFKYIKTQIIEKFEEHPGLIVNAEFDFPLDPALRDEYEMFITRLMDEGLLEVKKGPGMALGGDRWSDTYVQSSYQQGMANAYSRAGYAALTGLPTENWISAQFFTPFHENRIELLYTRTFEQLRGVSDVMGSQLRAELSSGLIQGLNPRSIAQNMLEKIDNLEKTRAETIARTEVMRAHSEASLDVYEMFQEEKVQLIVEFLHVNDDRVCPKCLAFAYQSDGTPTRMTVQEARGVLPLHPNCRCIWIPVPIGLVET